tara:strand:+ start:1504 stop:1611 length:108 start_codon:yes stop_codon:yes gene_type:complete
MAEASLELLAFTKKGKTKRLVICFLTKKQYYAFTR